MITLKIITPAKDRTGQVCSSYHKMRNGQAPTDTARAVPGTSLVKTGVSHDRREFGSMAEAYKFMQNNAGNAYKIMVG